MAPKKKIIADAGLFQRVPARQRGYCTRGVDEFFSQARTAYQSDDATPMSIEEVQQASFDIVKGGYRADEVDSALDRLEEALILRHRNNYIKDHGEAAWVEYIQQRCEVLLQRLDRPAGKRFRHPRNEQTQGYRCAEVDEFCRRIEGLFREDQLLDADTVRAKEFPAAAGKHAYDEYQVDQFLNRVVEVVSALDQEEGEPDEQAAVGS